MRWWILEDALKDRRGHYFEYLRTFKSGLEKCGDEVTIFSDRTAEPWIAGSLNARPELPRGIWLRMSDNAPKWKRLLRYPQHGWCTFMAWRGIFRGRPLPDVVFVPSVSTHHLVGIVPFLLLHGRKMPCTFLLFFPNTPVRHDDEIDAPALNAEPTARWFPWLLRRLRGLIDAGKVILAVETHALQAALTKLSGLPIHYLPHPVENQVSGRADSRASASPYKDNAIVVGHYGGSRFEKGSDLVQAGVRNYLEGSPDPRVRFAIQWTDDFADRNGSVVRKDEWLERHPAVTFITDYFDPDGGYERALRQTGIMLLPYRDGYRYRLSRVVIEAMIEGIPLALAAQTSLAEQAATHGAGVFFDQESPEGIVRSLEECVRRFSELKDEAEAKSRACAEHFSVAAFRSGLLGLMRST